MAERYQVVIVGGGPVGLGLAVDLGQRGISVALIEKNLAPIRIPKGQGLTARTMEHFHFWRVEEEIRASRLLPRSYPIGGLTAYGNLMSEYWYTQEGGAGRGWGFEFFFGRNERLPQYITEEVLRNRLTGLPSVTPLFGWTAERVEQDDHGVRVFASEAGWSSPVELEAEYLVGCDGGRSIVRDMLSIDRAGADFDQRMVLAVFRSKELHEGLKRFPERTTYRVLKPELQGYWQFFGRVDVGEGWFFHAPVPRETNRSNFDFLGLLREAAGFEFDAEFDHVGFWDLRISVAERYQGSRTFIAGDAAHTHPPYGGYGLNTGLEDVTNLGWKLAAALNGWGGDALLASYTLERQPIFVETGQAMIEGGIEKDRAFLNRYNPARDREEFEEAWNSRRSEREQSSYEPHYEGSIVVEGPPGGVCSIHGTHSLAVRPGHHLSPRMLSTGRDVFDELGPDFTLLAFGSNERDIQTLEAAATSVGVPLTTIRDSFQEDRTAYDARLILVRPDQYVAWSGNEPPADSAALMKKVAGQ